MLRSLNSGVSAMRQFQLTMDVIGNNIANVSTTGYKAARVDFKDSLSQTLGASGSGASMQVGTGVVTSSITNSFGASGITQTSVPTDLAVNGTGFFVVAKPGTGEQFATRAGDFKLDSSGYLVTSGGLRVQGFNDSALSARGDIQITDPQGRPPNFVIDVQGVIMVKPSDGSPDFVVGQILLQNFQNPQALVKEGGNVYSSLTQAGPLTQPAAPSTSGLGSIYVGGLELSNVDLAQEFSSLITTQRSFQASARIITTSDEVLHELVNLKR